MVAPGVIAGLALLDATVVGQALYAIRNREKQMGTDEERAAPRKRHEDASGATRL